jgi:1,4-dihydroxy-2-naphthoate octaprenyltransferase
MRAALAASRPAFLVLPPVTVLLGVATAIHAGAGIDTLQLALVLITALGAHVAVNTLNEYQDFHSGLDLQTTRTPFSGGSGALPARPEAAGGVLATSLAALAITVSAGLYLVMLRGPALLWLGLAGVALILSYTRWLNRHPWLCLVAPGLGFGPLMVVGTHLALSSSLGMQPLLVSLVPFLLTNNLLLLNQYPDMTADRSVGRNTFPIAYGIARSNTVYATFLLLAAATLIGGVLTGLLPPLTLGALLPLGFGAAALRGARGHGDDIAPLLPALGMNVAASVLTPLLLACLLLLS